MKVHWAVRCQNVQPRDKVEKRFFSKSRNSRLEKKIVYSVFQQALHSRDD